MVKPEHLLISDSDLIADGTTSTSTSQVIHYNNMYVKKSLRNSVFFYHC